MYEIGSRDNYQYKTKQYLLTQNLHWLDGIKTFIQFLCVWKFGLNCFYDYFIMFMDFHTQKNLTSQ